MKAEIEYTPVRIRPSINTPFRVLVLFAFAVITMIIVANAG
jgi:hypothetical protein